MRIFPHIHNLEEELIAMMASFQPSAITDEAKDEARSRVLARLKQQTTSPVQADSWSELRELLKLQDISMSLFKACLWHLDKGDRDAEGKSRIKVSRPGNLDNWRAQDSRIAVAVFR
jgi:hypothetical protein